MLDGLIGKQKQNLRQFVFMSIKAPSPSSLGKLRAFDACLIPCGGEFGAKQSPPDVEESDNLEDYIVYSTENLRWNHSVIPHRVENLYIWGSDKDTRKALISFSELVTLKGRRLHTAVLHFKMKILAWFLKLG